MAQGSRVPTLIAFVLVMVALVIGLISGITTGSIAGAIVALIAIIPAAWGMWAGIQEKTQGGLAMSIIAFLCAVGVAGILIVLKIIDWL